MYQIRVIVLRRNDPFETHIEAVSLMVLLYINILTFCISFETFIYVIVRMYIIRKFYVGLRLLAHIYIYNT